MATAIKHPHLSIVQFFKEPLQFLQQRSEIMINLTYLVNPCFRFISITAETTKTEIRFKNTCKNNRFPAITPFR
ncbi:hypothetical protein CEW87_11245 [Parazoarcus communis]|uniref:Uncharacterized protein n=1 Tax=Parazoarcus communis TaxID=41977 RepID=A0A2U8H501_9RHOO|nr:hypothetical protein [Parazoarcus communis]AWI79895.1 hypothetical protein CEW87_11245 [Parazoarcus communis]